MKKIVNFKTLSVVGIILTVWVIIILNNAANEDKVMEYDTNMVMGYTTFHSNIGELGQYFSQLIDNPALKYDESWNGDFIDALETMRESANDLVLKDIPKSREEQGEYARNTRYYANKFVDNYVKSIETGDMELEDRAVTFFNSTVQEAKQLDYQMRKDWEK